MNKIFILILLNFLFSCHKKNELDNIKDTKIDGYSTTWGVSSEKLSVCHQTGKWSIGKERKDWAEAIFECDITDEAIEPYNIKMEEYSKNSISLKPKIVSARMVLKVLHSKEKDDERIGNEFESSIVIYVNFTNNEKSAIVINSTDKTNKIIAENKNPIDSIIPSPPMLQL